MDSQKIKKEFEEIILSGLAKTPLPYVQHDSIRIGKVVITPKSDGYNVYNLTTKQRLGKTLSKRGALALAKVCSNRCSTEQVQNILDLDRGYNKYEADCIFYLHTIRKTKDDFKREMTEMRYHDATDRRDSYAEKINKFIFS